MHHNKSAQTAPEFYGGWEDIDTYLLSIVLINSENVSIDVLVLPLFYIILRLQDECESVLSIYAQCAVSFIELGHHRILIILLECRTEHHLYP